MSQTIAQLAASVTLTAFPSPLRWNWGGGAPSGTVKEVVTEGEAKVTTKRGNEVKKHASEENPAIKIDAGSSDAVKRVSIALRVDGYDGHEADHPGLRLRRRSRLTSCVAWRPERAC